MTKKLDSKTEILMWINADEVLDHNFNSMNLEEIAKNYILSLRSINELYHAIGGKITLATRVDEEAERVKETIKNLEQYKKIWRHILTH